MDELDRCAAEVGRAQAKYQLAVAYGSPLAVVIPLMRKLMASSQRLLEAMEREDPDRVIQVFPEAAAMEDVLADLYDTDEPSSDGDLSL